MPQKQILPRTGGLRLLSHKGRGRLHIFNPDTDYALANGNQWFTPPQSVVELRKSLALMPALYATPGEDAILLLDIPSKPVDNMQYHKEAMRKNLRIFTIGDLAKSSLHLDEMCVEPWGWNMAMRRFVADKIGDTPGLPTEEDMVRLRELSHRRTTIAFMQQLRKIGIVGDEIETPREIFDTADAIEVYISDKRLYFKSPWSSSGRGILLCDDLELRHVEPWVRGIIERQGSVLMEKAYVRKLDFASEWICADGEVKFLGWSVFSASRRGKYHGQMQGSQQELRDIIAKNAQSAPERMIEAQREVLTRIISPYYNGPAGIDMLITESGAVNPCVEINLRHTMGMLDLL